MLRLLGRLIGGSPLIPPDEVTWQLACFEWLLRGTGGFGRFRNALLVLPTDESFPQRGLQPGALEHALFLQIKEHAGLASSSHRHHSRASTTATDMAAVFLGFGVFLANAAFGFAQSCARPIPDWSHCERYLRLRLVREQ